MTGLHLTVARSPVLRALPAVGRLLGLAPPSATSSGLDVADAGDHDDDGYAVLVEFTAGDHEYWNWRPNEPTAQRLCRRNRNYFAGCGIARMTVVPISRTQARQHAEFSRCRAGNCPGATRPVQ